MPPSDEPITSIVMLLARPRVLDKDEVERAAEAAFEILFNTDENQIITIPDRPLHAVRTPDFTFGVVHSDQPYWLDVMRAANAAPTFAAREAILNHRGWISVDLMRRYSSLEPDEAYPLIGALIAELITPDTLALIRRPDGKIAPWDRCFLQLLQSGNAHEVFKIGTTDPIIESKADDQDLAAAAEEARRRLPEFLTAFAIRRPDQHFGVKKIFTEGGRVEHMWICVTRIENNVFHGTLSNTPNVIRNLREHAPVSSTPDEVEDWLYTDGSKTIGGFQIAVFEKRK